MELSILSPYSQQIKTTSSESQKNLRAGVDKLLHPLSAMQGVQRPNVQADFLWPNRRLHANNLPFTRWAATPSQQGPLHTPLLTGLQWLIAVHHQLVTYYTDTHTPLDLWTAPR